MYQLLMLYVNILCVVCVIQNDWRKGRATFYGHESWIWSIHKGSCGFGYQCKDEGTGWDVAAMPSTHPDFTGSCGSCYEVKCAGANFKDTFNNLLDRTRICRDEEASVIVKIVDACPCNDNILAYSVWKWCCGDMDHLDLSIWAFEKLADPKWGVIGLEYRQVECDYQPNVVAQDVWNPTPGIPAPASNPCIGDQSNNVKTQQQNLLNGLIYDGKIQENWSVVSHNAEMYEIQGQSFDKSGAAMCGALPSGGTLIFQGVEGAFKNQLSLEFLINVFSQDSNNTKIVANKNISDSLEVSVAGDKAFCGGVNLQNLVESGKQGDFSRYNIYLNLFKQNSVNFVAAFASNFIGCNGQDAQDIKYVIFFNPLQTVTYFCIDQVRLLG